MAPKFGTSGLRGLVTDLTEDLVGDYTRAFLAACPTGGRVHVGWDLRPSSPRIAEAVMTAAEREGVPVVECGLIPTPALALQSMKDGQAAIMVTGSHIPADRNGLKFYVPNGEIGKDDELAINAALGRISANSEAPSRVKKDGTVAYAARYADAFGPDALRGLRIGVYQHSSVARDVMVDVVKALGAEAVPLAHSDTFIPVDTEALDPETRSMLASWVEEHDLDAVISTDGDADRPMLADKTGAVVPGDVLGALSADFLKAEAVCTPVSSNTMVLEMGFGSVDLTRIGSPYVIAAMEKVLAGDASAKVVGYEANGGFLLGFTAEGPCGSLAPLMTRDCLLPLLAPLSAAVTSGKSLTELQDALPPRFTAADRIAGIETDVSKAFLSKMIKDASARTAFFASLADETSVDTTDGLRVRFASGDVVHLRPSGNAPEFRCYAEASSKRRALDLVAEYLAKLKAQLG